MDLIAKKPDEKKEQQESEDDEENKQYDSLGIEIRKNDYEIQFKRSSISRFRAYIQKNPIFGVAGAFILIIFIYMLAIYQKLGELHYVGIVTCVSFMLWIAVVEDAQVTFKFVSLVTIFVAIILFMSI